MSNITYKERFFATKSPYATDYAPMTIGAPGNIHFVDQNAFSHSQAEKDIKKAVKHDWKKQMKSIYGEAWKKHLNPPETLKP